MYKVQESHGVITLFHEGKEICTYADYKEMALLLLDELEFSTELFNGEIWSELALTKRAYPEQRMGQIIGNAIAAFSGLECACFDLFDVSDEELIKGLQKLFERKLVPFDQVKKECDAKDKVSD